MARKRSSAQTHEALWPVEGPRLDGEQSGFGKRRSASDSVAPLPPYFNGGQRISVQPMMNKV